jgi:SAM-dependent methyltransferase
LHVQQSEGRLPSARRRDGHEDQLLLVQQAGQLRRQVEGLGDLHLVPREEGAEGGEEVKWADQAIDKLLAEYSFDTVLDVGCGSGDHVRRFVEAGKRVTAVDIRPKLDPLLMGQVEHFAQSLAGLVYHHKEYDCVWASHVLEHQPNVGLFLGELRCLTKPGGVLAVTVPTMNNTIVGGHLSLWNAGLLMYNLVLAGFDCREARALEYSAQISVILTKSPVRPLDLCYDSGDVTAIAEYLPVQVANDMFEGRIRELNWRKKK